MSSKKEIVDLIMDLMPVEVKAQFMAQLVDEKINVLMDELLSIGANIMPGVDSIGVILHNSEDLQNVLFSHNLGSDRQKAAETLIQVLVRFMETPDGHYTDGFAESTAQALKEGRYRVDDTGVTVLGRNPKA